MLKPTAHRRRWTRSTRTLSARAHIGCPAAFELNAEWHAEELAVCARSSNASVWRDICSDACSFAKAALGTVTTLVVASTSVLCWNCGWSLIAAVTCRDDRTNRSPRSGRDEYHCIATEARLLRPGSNCRWSSHPQADRCRCYPSNRCRRQKAVRTHLRCQRLPHPRW